MEVVMESFGVEVRRAGTRAMVAGVLLAMAAAVTPAGAAQLELFGGTLSYSSAPVDTLQNALTVSLANSVYTIDDPNDPIDIGTNASAAGCVAVDSNTITCPAAPITALALSTGGADDHITLENVAVPALVVGGPGNDTLQGGPENDTFIWEPGDGSDVIDGGAGQDTLTFTGANASEHIAITPDGSGFQLARDVASILMKVQNTEVLRLATLGGDDEVSTTNLIDTLQMIRAASDIDTDIADTLRVDGAGLCVVRVNDTFETAGRQPIQFASFDDVILANAFCGPDPCEGAVATLGCTVNGVRDQPCQGTPGNDVIIGTAGNDVILGGGGNDRISGRKGDDLLCGEEGDDHLVGGPGNDTLVGGPGADSLRGNGGNDVLLGGDDDDDLSGGSGMDALDGGLGDDRLRGDGDADALQGGAGSDALDGGRGDDRCGDADQVGPFLRCELP
jgi:Ca2+-binding RTX toxin-like protein